jgi:hypothetical protein
MSGEFSLDEVHEMLGLVDQAELALSVARSKSIQIERNLELSEVILQLLDWSSTAYVENSLGINSALLSKFVKMRGTVPLHQAKAIASRLRTLLRSMDQTSAPAPALKARKAPVPPPKKELIIVAGEQWVSVASSSQTKIKIAAVSALLETIIEQTGRSNAPPEDQALSNLERQQLIAVLETALNVLKSPLAEKGLIKKAGEMLRESAGKAVEKGVQEALGALMMMAAKRISELVAIIFR